jgi:L-ascorbate metabolism protein UlaG (beta-lactamase superfamily)
MRIRWYGQSAFLLGDQSVFIDPFASMEGLVARGLQFDYPAIEGVEPDLLLVTHEHADHNGVEAIGGSPQILRSTAGTFESPLGEVVAIASEHDDVAGTERGPNTIVVFELDGIRIAHFGDFGQPALRPEQRDHLEGIDLLFVPVGGLRVCHFGDFGQAELRAEQRRAIGEVDVLFLPVGDGPTVGGERAAAIVRTLRPRLVVPMHYRTAAVNFLDPPDVFLDALAARVERLAESELVAERLLGTAGEPVVALPAAPVRA